MMFRNLFDKMSAAQSVSIIVGTLLVVTVAILLFSFVFLRDDMPRFFQTGGEFENAQTGIFVIGEKTLSVEVAKTGKERIQGLSGRNIIPHDGMFFIFDTDAMHGIWMKDMHFAIDILWIGSDFRVIDFKENVLPSTYPEVFVPETPARYVLEIPSGMLKRLGAQKGDPTFFVLERE